MRSTLTITPTPFRSSHLALPPSPFTPQLPISPPPNRPATKPTLTNNNNPKLALTLPPPPTQPLKWLWQCHCCARIYHLGTTRRCLDDGHYFCAGTVVKRDRKTGQRVVRRSRACASEFDYAGWKGWGVWRRDVGALREAAEVLAGLGEGLAKDEDGDLRIEDVSRDVVDVPRPLRLGGADSASVSAGGQEKDCWNHCDYPSECRWGKQFGAAQTQAQYSTAAVVAPQPPPPPPPSVSSAVADEPTANDLEKPRRSFDGISALPAMAEEAEGDACPPAPAQEEPASVAQESTKKPTFDDLLESAKRRKRRSVGSPPSPLASNPPSPTEELNTATATAAADVPPQASAHSLQKAFDDFELDVRKSIGRASVLLNGLVQGLKSGGSTEEERADAFVKGSRSGHRKKRSVVLDEDGQSLSE